MVNYLISYADEKMTISQDRLHKSADGYGFIHKKFGPKDIDEKFYELNKRILTQPRGAGYWLWKPYFIYKTLNSMNEGDVLIYSDAGIEFIANPLDHIEFIDIFLFANNHKHYKWCKGSVNGYFDTSDYEGYQVQASIIMIKNSMQTRHFIDVWLSTCQLPGMIDDTKNSTPNHSGFIEHRHDQAILTCLAVRNNIILHWWPAQYESSIRSQWPEDKYPQLFFHHRKRNDKW